jgi:hypothetical protein
MATVMLVDALPRATLERWGQVIRLFSEHALGAPMESRATHWKFEHRKDRDSRYVEASVFGDTTSAAQIFVQYGCAVPLVCPLAVCSSSDGWSLGVESSLGFVNRSLSSDFTLFRDHLKQWQGPISEGRAFEFIALFIAEFLRFRDASR